MNKRIAISTISSECEARGRQLADELGLDFIPLSASKVGYDFLLLLTSDYLALARTGPKKLAPFHIDFSSGQLNFRRQHASRRNELLARAIGIPPTKHPLIVDATAGFGRDSFILANLGYEITMIERSAIVFHLLADALQRAEKNPILAPIIKRLKLIHDDASEWLKHQTLHSKPAVVYLDPMFPEKQKSASSKKEMQLLQDLLGKCNDLDELFKLAFTCATNRVVVKRPRLAGNITALKPSFSLAGKSSRFDVYLK